MTLKRIYELNPELTESAAKRNILAPAGNKWMGLTRVEILEVMRRIRQENRLPPDDFYDYGCRSLSPHFSHTNFFITSVKSNKKGTTKSKKSKIVSSAKERKAKSTTKIKTPTVPLQHIPGPKHLHTNVCIRPWEATLDGWNTVGKNDEVLEEIETATAQTVEFDNPPNSPRRSGGLNTSNNWRPHKLTELPSEHGDEEDYLTLEIFNPVFKIYR